MTTEAVMDKPLFLPSKSSKHITNQGKQFIVQYDEVYSNFIAPIIAESKTKQYQITCMTRSHDTYTSVCVIWRAVSIAHPAETYVVPFETSLRKNTPLIDCGAVALHATSR